jgi:hypothetical protein
MGAGAKSYMRKGFQFLIYEEIRKYLKGLSHEIDFKNFDKNLQNLA